MEHTPSTSPSSQPHGSPQQLPTPQVFADRFVVHRALGQGGFGSVYHVFDRERHVHVALKRLSQQDPAMFVQFKKEFRALAHIAHPNLVALHELFWTDNECFFTMELVEGQSFLSYVCSERSPTLSQPPMSPEQAHPKESSLEPDDVSFHPTEAIPQDSFPHYMYQPTLVPTPQPQRPKRESDSVEKQPEITEDATPTRRVCDEEWLNEERLRSALKQLVRGVFVLHQHGKLHRDLKPPNVLITEEGRLVILDFGLVMDLEASAFESLVLAGTPVYMPPERAPSEAGDWYSVGVMLYEALTGRLPFEGSPLEVLAKKRQMMPSPPSMWVEGLPEDLERLCMDLLHMDPSMRPTGTALVERLGIALQADEPRPRSMMFVGRDADLLYLQEAWQQTRRGHRRVVLLEGRTGSGKSTLMSRFLKQLTAFEHGQLQVFSSRCYEQESMPYRGVDGWVDVLSHYLNRQTHAESLLWFPHQLAALLRLFPVLKRVRSIQQHLPSTSVAVDSQELRAQAFRGFRALFQSIAARKPTVVFLDDMQWIDEDSARLLEALLRSPDAPLFLLVLGFRSEDLPKNPSLQRLIQRLQSEAPEAVVNLALAELDRRSARELVQHALGEEQSIAEPLLEGLLQNAGGNPLLLSTFAQYIRSLPKEQAQEMASTSRSSFLVNDDDVLEMDYLRDVVLVVLSRLSKSAQWLLRILAVAGQAVEEDVLDAIMGDASNWLAELPRLRAHHLVRVIRVAEGGTERALDVYHQQIRHLVLTSLSPSEQQIIHHQIGDALAQLGNVEPERKARHFYASEQPDKALAYLLEAAEKAHNVLAFSHAARLYQQALDWTRETATSEERRSYLIRMAEAYANMGHSARAAEAFLEASSEASAIVRLQLRQKAAAQWLRSGHVSRALDLFSEVFGALGLPFPRSSTTAIVRYLALRTRMWGRGRLSLPPADSSMSLPQQEQLQLDASYSLALIYGQIDPVVANYFQSLHLWLARRSGERGHMELALVLESAYRSLQGGAPQRSDALRQLAVSSAKQTEHPRVLGLAKSVQGVVSFVRGQWMASYHACSEADALYRRHCRDAAWERATTQIFRMNALLFMGDMTRIQRELPGLLEDASERGDLFTKTFLSWGVLPKLHLAQNEPEKALSAIQEAADDWDMEHFDLQRYIETLALAEIDLFVGKPLDAMHRVEGRWSDARELGLLFSRFHRAELYHMLSRAALASAVSYPAQDWRRNTMLDKVKKGMRQLSSLVWGEPLTLLLQAGVASLSRPTEEVIPMLVLAETKCHDLDMRWHASVARYAWGLVEGGERGDRLCQEATERLRQQGVMAVEESVRMLAPGAWCAKRPRQETNG
jgi:serine/threonine protein kinase/tetratricopeptide (TPR) repeat protein